MNRMVKLFTFSVLIAFLSPVTSSYSQAKPITFKVVGEEVFDFIPDKNLKVGKIPSKKLQKSWARLNCPDSYSYTHVQVLGASRKIISSSKLQKDVTVESGRWVLDENEENVFRMELSCLFEARLKLAQSGYYVFQLRNGNVFNDVSPRYDLETLKENNWKITYFDIPRYAEEGYAWWDPSLPTPVPNFQILGSGSANGISTTEFKMTSSIYTRGKFFSSRIADDYWYVYVYDDRDESISYSSVSETFKVSSQIGQETRFRFRVDGTNYPSCSENPKDPCRPTNWVFVLDSNGKQLKLESTYRE